MLIQSKNSLIKQTLFVIVDVSASTGAFVGMVCLIRDTDNYIVFFIKKFHLELVYRSTYEYI